MHLRSLLARAAHLYPDNLAIVDGDERASYLELHARVERIAGGLAELGVGAGDRVAILASNRAQFLESYFACAHVDAVLVPLNTRLTSAELHAILLDAEPCVLVCEGAMQDLGLAAVAGSPVRAVLWLDPGPARGGSLRSLTWEAALLSPRTPAGAGRGGDQLAHLYYTSGTTGRPKGVMLSHRAVCSHALMTIAELQLGERDVWGHFAPMFHLADAWATFAITQVGGTHVFLRRFTAADALATIARHRITVTNLVPTMLNLMVKDASAPRFDYSSLRLVLSGGASIAPEVVRQIVALFRCDYVQTYGMTETSPFLTMSLLKEPMRVWPEAAQLAMRSKTGRPVLGVDLRVVRDDGALVTPDERDVGEIQVRGETVTHGYWRQPDATAAAFTADGYLRTGDLAVVDSEGYVTIVDRKKDVINTGGEKVYGIEVENVLYTHPAVLECAVYGQPDPIWGEAVAAAIVLRPGAHATADDIVGHCRPALAGFKVPRVVRFLDALPRTGSGKIQKRLLREG